MPSNDTQESGTYRIDKVREVSHWEATNLVLGWIMGFAAAVMWL